MFDVKAVQDVLFDGPIGGQKQDLFQRPWSMPKFFHHGQQRKQMPSTSPSAQGQRPFGRIPDYGHPGSFEKTEG